MDWLGLIIISVSGVFIVAFWQFISELWEKRGGGAALPRSYMAVIGGISISLMGFMYIIMSGQNG